jgi:hypothetical protein
MRGLRHRLLAVGNWPEDFDGAIVLYPAWNAAALNLHFGKITRELAKPVPSRAARSARCCSTPRWKQATASMAWRTA